MLCAVLLKSYTNQNAMLLIHKLWNPECELPKLDRGAAAALDAGITSEEINTAIAQFPNSKAGWICNRILYEVLRQSISTYVANV